jgi:hypothetical protein
MLALYPLEAFVLRYGRTFYWSANRGRAALKFGKHCRTAHKKFGNHHVAGPYLSAYASEMAWRENNRRVSNGEQYLMAANAALQHPVSRQWKGYWQR